MADVSFVDCDVLVIGGGSAGCWAAIRAKELVDNVVLVDKAKVSRGGMSTFSAGVMLHPTEEDNLDDWLKEIVTRGEYLADQEWTTMFLKEHPKRVKQLEEWGVPFERDEKGAIMRVKGRAHKVTRTLMYHSKKYIETLRDQLVKRNVRLMERIMITDLLTSDGNHPTGGSVVGAVGINTRTGQFYVFRAKATVMSAGGVWGKVWGYTCDNITSDSMALTYRAGAELTGIEFICSHHNSIWNRNYQAAGLNLIQGNGVRWLNKDGERFMLKYSPELADREKLATVCAAEAKEVIEGRGPTYADMRSFPEETWNRFRRVLPFLMTVFDHAGIDPRTQLIENHIDVRVRSENGDGGIFIGMKCESSLQGLYAAGAATKNPCQGTYAVGGVNIAYNNVSGYVAGESAAAFAKSIDKPKIVSSQVRGFEETVFAPLNRKDGTKGDRMFEDILKMITPYEIIMFKHEARMLKTLQNIASMEKEVERLSANNPHELVIANEVKNYLLACRLHFTAAMQRKESRGFLHREEYPYRDDKNWLKWIIMQRGADDEPVFKFVHIPFEKYPIKPEQMEIIPEKVQLRLQKS